MNMFRFPTKLSFVLVVSGGLIALGGAVFAARMFVAPHTDWSRLGAYLLVSVGGLLVLAYGEIIGAIFAIENNTRRIEENSRRALSRLERLLDERTAPLPRSHLR